MIIYTDSYMDPSKMTPAHDYAAETTFENILDNIASGAIVCGTGQPFPIDWKGDSDEHPQADYSNPWQAQPGQFIDPTI